MRLRTCQRRRPATHTRPAWATSRWPRRFAIRCPSTACHPACSCRSIDRKHRPCSRMPAKCPTRPLRRKSARRFPSTASDPGHRHRRKRPRRKPGSCRSLHCPTDPSHRTSARRCRDTGTCPARRRQRKPRPCTPGSRSRWGRSIVRKHTSAPRCPSTATHHSRTAHRHRLRCQDCPRLLRWHPSHQVQKANRSARQRWRPGRPGASRPPRRRRGVRRHSHRCAPHHCRPLRGPRRLRPPRRAERDFVEVGGREGCVTSSTIDPDSVTRARRDTRGRESSVGGRENSELSARVKVRR